MQAMRPEVQASPRVQLVLRMRTHMAANDYVGFFATVRAAPYLLACLVHSYFPAVRAAAFAAICTGAQTDRSFPSPSISLPAKWVAVPLEYFVIVSTLLLDCARRRHFWKTPLPEHPRHSHSYSFVAAVFSKGQQALPLEYFVRTLLLDDKAEAAELCALYDLPLESQGGHSVALVNKVWLSGPQGRLRAVREQHGHNSRAVLLRVLADAPQ